MENKMSSVKREQIIKKLNAALKDAKEGKIDGILLTYVNDDGATSFQAGNSLVVLGLAQVAMHRVNKQIDDAQEKEVFGNLLNSFFKDNHFGDKND